MKYSALVAALALVACDVAQSTPPPAPETTSYINECNKRGPWTELRTFKQSGCIGEGVHAVETATAAECAWIVKRWRQLGQSVADMCETSRVVVRTWPVE